MNRPSREADLLIVSGIGGIAFLLALSPIVNLVTTCIGAIFVVAAILGLLFGVVIRLREGRSITGTFLELAILNIFIFVVVFGPM